MLIIHASELAACIGLNKYRPVAEAAVTVYKRMDPEGYYAALARNRQVPKEDVTQRIQHNVEVVDAVAKAINAPADELQGKLDDVVSCIPPDDDGTPEDKADLVSEIRSLVHTERGRIKEKASLDRTEITMKRPILQRNSRYFKTRIPYGSKELQLGGRVDGITEDGCLIEVKNRMYRVFSTIPVYEQVQIHAYMVLTCINSCQFVQSFKDQETTESVSFDHTFWDDVVTRLQSFAVQMDELISDETKQDALIKRKEFSEDASEAPVTN